MCEEIIIVITVVCNLPASSKRSEQGCRSLHEKNFGNTNRQHAFSQVRSICLVCKAHCPLLSCCQSLRSGKLSSSMPSFFAVTQIKELAYLTKECPLDESHVFLDFLPSLSFYLITNAAHQRLANPFCRPFCSRQHLGRCSILIWVA